jgi:3-methyladenine DNA glycosylase AlkD
MRDEHVSVELIEALRAGLAAVADPARAPAMQAYMKSTMPYWGVPAPVQKRVFREVLDAHRLPSFEAWRETLLALWRGAERREERYGALALAGHRYYRAYQVREALAVYEELVVTGAWWDYIDDVASHRLGALLRDEREWMPARMREWAVDEGSMWKRRAAILCQLGMKAETDLALLYDCIEPNLGDREFFIRKAIGWALRQYAWTDPAEVARYVEANAERLSPLSRREALKNIGRTRGVAAGARA